MNGRVTVEVADDGVGGADAAGGSGLRGLADRVAALDGTLSLDSPAGRGTRLQADIPLTLTPAAATTRSISTGSRPAARSSRAEGEQPLRDLVLRAGGDLLAAGGRCAGWRSARASARRSASRSIARHLRHRRAAAPPRAAGATKSRSSGSRDRVGDGLVPAREPEVGERGVASR